MRLHHLGAALSRSCLLPSYSALLLLPLPACGLPAALQGKCTKERKQTCSLFIRPACHPCMSPNPPVPAPVLQSST